jgi:hypothetical protein
MLWQLHGEKFPDLTSAKLSVSVSDGLMFLLRCLPNNSPRTDDVDNVYL